MAALESPELLDAAALESALGDGHIGKRVLVFPVVASTNDLAWRLAEEGAEAGLAVFAEHQTAGRGQRGRCWESAPSQGLCFSLLLRPNLAPAESARLTNWAAENIANTIAWQCGIPARIKPPNDVYVDSRKVAGVLVEMRVERSGAYAAIAGFGININQGTEDFSPELRAHAGSLALAGGRSIDRQAFALELLRNLDCTYGALVAL
jgi:BirA family biotin operon repressor/biotin-[acetyl-CoA-carboxylase] ligase